MTMKNKFYIMCRESFLFDKIYDMKRKTPRFKLTARGAVTVSELLIDSELTSHN